MAQVFPPLHTINVMSQGQHAEVELLRQLAAGLPDTFHLFHSVDWAQASPSGDSHGEIDIVVVNQGGDVALLEVKSGELQFTAQGLFKRYGEQTRNVSSQVHWQFGGIQHRLRSAGLDVRLMHFLVLPHATVANEAASIGFPRERLLDQTDCQALAQTVLSRVGSGRPDAVCDKVCAFLLDRLQCKVDVAALAGHLRSWTQHVSGGLAEWVPRIQAPSRVVRVQGTAGSGKTQLALSLLRRAAATGRRAAYICFNRPLADHMRDIAPPSCEVQTFHQLCWAAAHPATAGTTESGPGVGVTATALAESIEGYRAAVARQGPDLDVLIVDELQDFHGEWLVMLVERLQVLSGSGAGPAPGAVDGLYLLDDPDQCLYADRQELDIADAVVVACHDNHRSPRRVVDTVNQLRLTAQPINPRSPFAGALPGFTRWKVGSANALKARTVDAVQACLNAGYGLEQVCVLTWRGLERSVLLNENTLGPWSLARYTGRFDASGRPVFTEGELRMETLRRFKGQSSAAVVLTEIDFEAWTDLERRMLFVGMTRASMHLELVLSDRAEALLMNTLA
jgi:UvrD-like helicase C-terminal domain/AAA domain/Nuclease-related domain